LADGVEQRRTPVRKHAVAHAHLAATSRIRTQPTPGTWTPEVRPVERTDTREPTFSGFYAGVSAGGLRSK
jgi:hypothetical protein